jgi:hypothetical protein
MEVLLNSIWLLVAMGAFLFWQAEGEEGTARRREHHRRFRLLALACALILLFPVMWNYQTDGAKQAAEKRPPRG